MVHCLCNREEGILGKEALRIKRVPYTPKCSHCLFIEDRESIVSSNCSACCSTLSTAIVIATDLVFSGLLTSLCSCSMGDSYIIFYFFLL